MVVRKYMPKSAKLQPVYTEIQSWRLAALSVGSVMGVRFFGAMVQFHSSLTVNICSRSIVQSHLVVYFGI